jgi:hypothetical protein
MGFQRTKSCTASPALPRGGTTLVFVALFSLGWIVSCSFNYLNTIHKFPDEIFKLVTRLEIGVVYIDAVVSGVVLTAGIIRFVIEVFEGI